MSTIREDAPLDRPLAVGQYHEMTRADDAHISVGELVLITAVTLETVHFACGDQTFHMPRADFDEAFRPAPHGPTTRQAEIARLMQEVATAGEQVVALGQTLERFNPHVTAAGALDTGAPRLLTSGEVVDEDSGDDLDDELTGDGDSEESTAAASNGAALVAAVPAPGSPSALRAELATVRQTIARTKRMMAARQKRLAALLAEQQAVLAAAMKGLSAQLEKAESGLRSIRLYLGEGEHIEQIADGNPAPADAPIAVRQLVLYADEETAIAAEEGGLDIRQLDDLDAWLQDPAHIAQVLPNEKGVVAFKLRRTEREYGDAWLNDQMNRENLRTYFLFRNGARLYRLTTALAVGETLLPLADEFEALFRTPRLPFGIRHRADEPLRPGSDAYMEILKQAEAKYQHYLRVMLVLQGVADRTPIWAPLPTDASGTRLNFFDLRQHDRYVTLVMDAEASRMLGTGRPSFDAWLRATNAQLDVGHRIVGCFHHWTHGFTREWERVSPWRRPWRHQGRETPRLEDAYLPTDDAIHTIARKEQEAFVVLFDRRDEVYRRGEGYVRPAARASCKVYRSDRILIDVDAATVEDMEYYLQSRTNRHAYAYMFPVLKRAIRAKRVEAEAEAPFITLLIGEIMKAHGAAREDAARLVPELVRWYKFATRTHRALATDDQKALRMIVTEYGHRAQRATERAAADDRPIIEALHAERPDAVCIAHKRAREYVVLVPENAENLFVREETWRADRTGAVRCTKAARWRLVDARHERWAIRFAADRWASWRVNARLGDVLTDPERLTLLEAAWPAIEQDLQWQHTHDDEQSHRLLRPLAATVGADGTFMAWYCDRSAMTPMDRLLTARVVEPSFAGAEIRWARTPTGVRLTGVRTAHYTFSPHWDNGADPYEHGGPGRKTVVWRDDAAIAWFAAEQQRFLAAEVAEQRLERRQEWIWHAATALAEEAATAEARRAFLEDGHDEAEWPEHRERLHLPVPYADRVRRAAAVLLERGHPVAGLTFGALCAQASAFGFAPEEDDRDARLDPDTVLMTVDAWAACEAEAAEDPTADADEDDEADDEADDAAEDETGA